MPYAKPTPAARRPELREHHGHTFLDPYAWMRDKASPEFLEMLAAENRYTEAMTAQQAELREAIFSDISSRTQQTDLSVPEFVHHEGLGDFWYYARTTQGLDYPSFHRCRATNRDDIPGLNQPVPEDEELLLDAQALAEGTDFFALGTLAFSPDGSKLAYSVDISGDERYQLRFRDLLTGTAISDLIPDVAAGGVWFGNDAFAYLTVDDAWRPDRLWAHHLGSQGDQELYRETDERFWLGVDTSRDDRYGIVTTGSKNTTESWLVDLSQPDFVLRSVAPRRAGIEYEVEVASDRLFIVHNDGAPDFALAQAPLEASTAAEWETIWPGSPGVRLNGVTAYNRVLVISERRDGLQQVALRHRDSHGNPGAAEPIQFPEPLCVVDADDGGDADTDRIRLHYQSMVTPTQVWEYKLDDGERRLLKARTVLPHPERGPYRCEDYVQRREWAPAADGTLIPISVVFHRDTPLDGSAGCLLYGYGAYEISMSPSFSIARLSLLERGYVYAIAHVRGGGELGRAWYEGGKLANKENTFTDFIACANHLVQAGYTRHERMCAEGGSAGGLLIGAAVNLAPQAFAAVHAEVPFVDALTTVLNPELPLTVTEWEEWGDPLHDAEAYARMQRYSPYENVHPADYPAILVTTSLNDTRVEVTEPAKWVAALRHVNTSNRPILLRTEMVAGHGGASGRYQNWRDAAFELAWLISATPPL